MDNNFPKDFFTKIFVKIFVVWRGLQLQKKKCADFSDIYTEEWRQAENVED